MFSLYSMFSFDGMLSGFTGTLGVTHVASVCVGLFQDSHAAVVHAGERQHLL